MSGDNFCSTLEPSIVKEIELLRSTDENYWRVYGLGQIGSSLAIIFKPILIDSIPQNASFVSYGMDFGYTNDPTTLIAIFKSDTKH